MTTFSEADIIAAFEAATAEEEPGAGMTLLELVEATGSSQYTVRQKLKRLVTTRAWEPVKVHRQTMAGTMMRVTAYRPRGEYGNGRAAD